MKQKRHRIGTLAVGGSALILSSLFSVPALAADGFYGGIMGGANKIEEQDFRVFDDPGGLLVPRVPDDTRVTRTEYDDGGYYGAVIGYRFPFGLRPEIEYSRRLNDQDESLDLNGTRDDAGHIATETMFANLWFEIFPKSRIRPYVGGGYGYSNTKVNDLAYQGVQSARNEEKTYGDVFQVGGGILFDISTRLTMSLDYRYLDTEVGEYNFVDDHPRRTIREDYHAQSLGLTFSYFPFYKEPTPPPPPAPAPEVVAPQGPVDSDGDGVPDDLDNCPDTPAGVKVDENGCPLPECKDPVPGQPVNLDGCADGDVIVLRGVTFLFDKTTLTPEAEKVLDGVGEALNRSRVIEVELRGHTDSLGSDGYNQSLSEGRALAVKAYLANLGVDPARMTTLGFGESQPIADNGTKKGRALNRRVELKVVKGRALVAPIEITAPIK